MTFYLKYRPQTLDEVIGQEQVKKTLSLAYQNDKLSHAYLLHGPRGTGKTSTARILAKMVNCEGKGDPSTSLRTGSGKGEVPCNKCPTCISITDGSNLDLIEIDAASNRGIEDIRALREKIKLAPTSSKKKVYIIDETHMLTQEAFNALLKTLEEPPSHVLFILATTELGKIPATILSRVQKLDFKMATTEELLQVLEKITQKEKIDIDKEALQIVAKKAEGSFRDGVKLLDQLSSMKGKITTQSLRETLKSTQFDDLLDLMKSMAQQSAKESLLIISKQIESGVDIKELILSLMDTLRHLVFIKNGLGEQLVKPNLTEDKYEDLAKIAESFGSHDLIRDLDILQKALEKLKFASIPSLSLELAIVEMTQSVILSERSESKDLSQMRDSNPSASLRVHPEDSPRGAGKLRDSSLVVQSDKEEIATLPEFTPSEVEGVARNDNPDKSSQTLNPLNQVQGQGDGSPDILKIKEKWTFILETIRPYNFSLEALLRSTSIAECTDSAVVMEVPYSFHQRILEAPKNRDLLEGILSDVLGRPVKVSTILGTRSAKREDIANIEVAADDEIIRIASEIFNSEPSN